jgi:hypothetical protein
MMVFESFGDDPPPADATEPSEPSGAVEAVS